MKPKFKHICEDCTFLASERHYDYYFCSAPYPSIIARFGNQPGEMLVSNVQSDGTLIGDASSSWSSYWALAQAKKKNLFATNLESHILDNQKELSIYLVASTHDTYFRPIKAFNNKRAAETYAKACLEASKIWEKIYPTILSLIPRQPPTGWSLLDPNMSLLSDGTYPFYEVLTIPLSGDSTLDLSNDICPICHQQVYETSQGRICEQGHEVY